MIIFTSHIELILSPLHVIYKYCCFDIRSVHWLQSLRALPSQNNSQPGEITSHTESFNTSAAVARSEESTNLLLLALIAKFEQTAQKELSDAEPATFSSAIAKIVAI